MSQVVHQFAFGRRNYQILFIGLAIVVFGYILMSGGGTADPNEFNEAELFSPRRITLAPIMVLIGYAIVGCAIMYKPKISVIAAKKPAAESHSRKS